MKVHHFRLWVRWHPGCRPSLIHAIPVLVGVPSTGSGDFFTYLAM
jgi:hypothetical protein